MATATESVAEICAAAKRASRVLATLGSDVKNAALEAIADALVERTAEILEANARDLEAGARPASARRCSTASRSTPGGSPRSPRRYATIAALPDPVGEVIDGFRLPNGLDVRKVRVPLGVIAVVYEARPNVTIDAAALCLKSGNAIVLRGSSSAAHSNAVLAGDRRARRRVAAGLPDGRAVAGRRRRSRRARRARHADRRRRPDHPARRRGAEGGAQGRRHRAGDLRRVRQLPRLRGSPAPTSTTAQAIVLNAKVQRPGVCNAAETLLVHADVAAAFLPHVLARAARRRRDAARRRARPRAVAGAADVGARPTRTGTPSTWRSRWRSASSTRVAGGDRAHQPLTAAATPRRS